MSRIETEWKDGFIIVSWKYYAGTDDTWDAPGECADLDIQSAVWVAEDGTETDLTDDEVNELVEYGWKHDWWPEEPDIDPPDDYDDYEYEPPSERDWY